MPIGWLGGGLHSQLMVDERTLPNFALFQWLKLRSFIENFNYVYMKIRTIFCEFIKKPIFNGKNGK